MKLFVPVLAVVSDDVPVAAFIDTGIAVHNRVLRIMIIIVINDGDMIRCGNL